jgi:hypothetical protein
VPIRERAVTRAAGRIGEMLPERAVGITGQAPVADMDRIVEACHELRRKIFVEEQRPLFS